MVRDNVLLEGKGSRSTKHGLAETSDHPDDIYRTNIQISEINALNACLAIIRFKQLRGFYLEEVPHYQLLWKSEISRSSETQNFHDI